MTMLLKPLRTKRAKCAGKTAPKRAGGAGRNGAEPGRGASSRRESKTLAELNRWMEAHAQEIMAAAKKNTLRLTGREVI